MNFKLPNLDLLSFWLGFALATIFWLVILRISRLLPRMRKSIAQNRQRKELEKTNSQEFGIRKFTLRQAQSSHLASAFFPLERTLIEPMLLALPENGIEESEEQHSPKVFSILPYTPEVPELVADFPVREYSLSSVLITQPYICVSGQAGTGKTTALAAFASQLALNERTNTAVGYLPLFLKYSEFIHIEESPLACLVKYLLPNVKGLSRDSLEKIITHASTQGRLVVLVDGLDEFDRPNLETAVQWLHALQVELPESKIITTCNTYFTSGLESFGFNIFSLSAWGTEKRKTYLQRWQKAWAETLSGLPPEQIQQAKLRCERSALWLLQENKPFSPLELTLQVLLACSSATISPSSSHLYESYLTLVSGGLLKPDGFKALARLAEQNPYHTIEVDQALSTLSSNNDYVNNDLYEDRSDNGQGLKPEITKNRFIKKPIAQEILDRLILNNFFLPIEDGRIQFCHLSFYSFLQADSNLNGSLPELQTVLQSSNHQIQYTFKSFSQFELRKAIAWLDQDDHPLYRNLLIGSIWLKQTQPADPLRAEIFRRTALLLQDKSLPRSLKFRLLYPITQSKDPSIPSLLTIYRNHADAIIRQISAFGFGLLGDEKFVPILAELSRDSSIEVQQIACLSLGKIWSAAAQDALADVIFISDESTRAIACETLALHEEGHQMLQEIIATDNYLARRAAISGLVMIDEPWVHEILEKLSVEDPQWIVRDTAIFALEHPSRFGGRTPEKLMPVLENPWTLLKAEEYHLELPSKHFPSELLFRILEKGTYSDQVIALKYLSVQPEQRLIEQLNALARQSDSMLRDEAINALFSLSKRGLDVK